MQKIYIFDFVAIEKGYIICQVFFFFFYFLSVSDFTPDHTGREEISSTGTETAIKPDRGSHPSPLHSGKKCPLIWYILLSSLLLCMTANQLLWFKPGLWKMIPAGWLVAVGNNKYLAPPKLHTMESLIKRKIHGRITLQVFLWRRPWVSSLPNALKSMKESCTAAMFFVLQLQKF